MGIGQFVSENAGVVAGGCALGGALLASLGWYYKTKDDGKGKKGKGKGEAEDVETKKSIMLELEPRIKDVQDAETALRKKVEDIANSIAGINSSIDKKIADTLAEHRRETNNAMQSMETRLMAAINREQSARVIIAAPPAPPAAPQPASFEAVPEQTEQAPKQPKKQAKMRTPTAEELKAADEAAASAGA